MATIEQQIAQKEDELARLRKKSRDLANGQKIILGGMLIHAAEHNTKIRTWLLEEAARSITREADKKRLAPLLDELRMTPEPQRGSGEETPAEAALKILSDNAMRD
ncbi:hypothetical protein HFU84_01735 [Acidithiobacillus sp. CV18-2]|uniref:hypothetical protein n=1 Tax=Acidithiobacillus caldus TaxID=33059 RepID=UPI001C066F04|nr:hypothetical protein [Acidithiobacillus caldus]MBU2753437.1 hypothetical protein [Acidithiobacillus sp. CV18-3]MBU2756293.1 hypothetical protein [Acidithiobacillus sp. BN09-2]MBU2776257.1 hypothetical protein [Acidithiobacillus sp. CV18-2]MBU2800031.1 hypothetical protein [Acidithiobacillus sp. VAN18-4]MBU2763729.1 hypothetical protein [Acidithiobacillus caldus]